MPTDLDRLQGRWKITSLETDGRRASAALLCDAHVVIDGDTFTSLGMGAPYAGTLKLRRAKPNAFDLTFTSGHAAGTTHSGIYKLDGDTWTICFATTSRRRPTRFVTTDGSGMALEVLTRESGTPPRTRAKKSANAGRSAAIGASQRAVIEPAGPPTIIEGEWAMVSAVFDGKPMSEEMMAWCTRVTRGDITLVTAGPQTMLRARFTLDASQKPGAIDYENLHGGAKGKSQQGIFEVAGDTLSICMAPPGKPRPADFASSAHDGRSLTVWRRKA